MLNEFIGIAFAIYSCLIAQRILYFRKFVPYSRSSLISKELEKRIRRQFFEQKAYKMLEIPYKTHIIPVDSKNVVVYDHIAGFYNASNRVLVVPDFGSVRSLTGELTPLLEHFSDIYVLNPRLCSPFYKPTRPIHSRNIVDVEYLVNRLSISKIIALGAGKSVREYSKCMLRYLRIAVVPLEMTALKLKRFDDDRDEHLRKNTLIPFNHQQRIAAASCECYYYAELLDYVLTGGKMPQRDGEVRVLDVERAIRCQGVFPIVCACMWLNDAKHL